jgi:CBS domain-containing protein
MSKKVPLVVEDIMTRRVVTLLEEQNLSDVDDALRFFEYRHVPVVDGDRLVGIISRADLLQAAASRFEPRGDVHTASIAEHYFVADLMTREVRTVRPETSLVQAAETMRFHKVDCLPVTVDADRLVGIVTTTDFLTLSIHLLHHIESLFSDVAGR